MVTVGKLIVRQEEKISSSTVEKEVDDSEACGYLSSTTESAYAF